MIGRPRALSLSLAAALALGTGVLAQPPAAVASNGACPGKTGVTVVVDYQALGGGVVVRCAPGSPATGFRALTGAGFSIAEVQNVPGFLCRIDGKPTQGQDPCINTPPASRYWSYWHASRGGDWVVSIEGGKTRKPPAGSVEGWSFSDDGQPGGAAPPPGIDPPAPPKPATSKPATPKPATPRPATPRPTSRPATPKPTAGASIATLPSQAAAQPSPTSAGSSTASSDPVSAVVSATPSAIGAEGGTTETPSEPPGGPDANASAASTGDPPLGTLAGVGLVVVIGGAAFLAGRRRSRGDDASA